MKRENLYLIIGFAVPLLICLVSYWFSIYFPVIAAVTKDGGGEQWLGFFGNLIGASVTLLAALIAWIAVRLQVGTAIAENRRAEEKRLQDLIIQQTEAKYAAIAILEPVIRACNYVRICAEAYAASLISHHPDVVARDRLENAMRQLTAKTQRFPVEQGWQRLNATDQIRYMNITSQIHGLIDNFYGLVHQGEETRLHVLREELGNLENYAREFGPRLSEMLRAQFIPL